VVQSGSRPVTRYAFYFDASACSGCKACQVACKDRHGLPLGVRWRRVYEVVGGGWTRRDGAWLNDVIAYHVSMACNHCERAICMEVCPAGAITRRADGLVLLDAERCMGCRYCEWACPYGAPQYDASTGRMTKCTFCAEDLDLGGQPACVAACPLRVLDFGERAELEARHGPTPTMHPLPDPALTRPALALTAHHLAARPGVGALQVGNREEVRWP
jgi:anaerobic dimethyl sulfoxide reductase subunit B